MPTLRTTSLHFSDTPAFDECARRGPSRRVSSSAPRLIGQGISDAAALCWRRGVDQASTSATSTLTSACGFVARVGRSCADRGRSDCRRRGGRRRSMPHVHQRRRARAPLHKTSSAGGSGRCQRHRASSREMGVTPIVTSGRSAEAHVTCASPATRGGSCALPTTPRIDFAAAQCRVATNRHDGQITSDFPKSCQAQESKIFRFRSHANQSHNSACLTADEGRWPSSRTRGEMRWTRELRLTCVARAYGEVVWFGRRGAGAKSGRGEASLVATEAKEPFSGKSTK